MDKNTYIEAYWVTYGKMPDWWKPSPPGELLKLLKEIAPTTEELKEGS